MGTRVAAFVTVYHRRGGGGDHYVSVECGKRGGEADRPTKTKSGEGSLKEVHQR